MADWGHFVFSEKQKNTHLGYKKGHTNPLLHELGTSMSKVDYSLNKSNLEKETYATVVFHTN